MLSWRRCRAACGAATGQRPLQHLHIIMWKHESCSLIFTAALEGQDQGAAECTAVKRGDRAGRRSSSHRAEVQHLHQERLYQNYDSYPQQHNWLMLQPASPQVWVRLVLH